jgi:hypothetical protein
MITELNHDTHVLDSFHHVSIRLAATCMVLPTRLVIGEILPLLFDFNVTYSAPLNL